MTERVIDDLPTGLQGIIYDLAVSFGLRQPTPGEQQARAEMDREAGS